MDSCCTSANPRPPVISVCHGSFSAAVDYYVSRGYHNNRGSRALVDAAWFRPKKDILYFDADQRLNVLWPGRLKELDADIGYTNQGTGMEEEDGLSYTRWSCVKPKLEKMPQWIASRGAISIELEL
ncbi:uncharacterized protein F4817DRAFT_369255 [Daldinia loculata]|uniref:uncharacterized protein n=1 Tax=Daldinia loculata TaxID=103429 RepID=UPI0020C3E3CA|nr:uncharacterized protein F4817DRAFT_369255 [Daldinia loculata]KAI1642448.1 hypothetical protein F4817DRAFT_369255 [Daldinia loculata]